MRNIFRVPFVLIFVLLLTACSSNGFKADYKLKIEPFTFTNQHHEEVSLDDLKGQVWLGQFVFTNCATVCGPMMVNMTKLQDELVKENVEDYKIVSFTVDPAVDSPEVLQEYLDIFEPADESKWEMLTGYRQDTIAEIAKKSFATIVAPDPNSNQVTHGVNFYLVNRDGIVVKMYNGSMDVQYEDIVKDMKALIKQGA
ncbi:SCO family protein [Sporosarcina ureilytica]|uniref:Cytochrome c oxidase assembly protein n=1 Tax=Sporosarcina ureilytica TaxID=298596 RepID=A0A1D8JGE6_9BACL|nr:SCO family protein [Sporosarcina ureilytica]AOV07771.1 cytochrome c oxidase assembly protein [Sporosarcina ureilytica]